MIDRLPDEVSQAQRRICYLALLSTLVVAVILMLLQEIAIAKGLVLGTLFSILNFILLGKSVPMTLGRTRRMASFIGLVSILCRYLLLAVPMVVGIKSPSFNFFAVAVVDLKMPGMDGVETQKRLRGLQPFLQCIVLTAHGSIDSALESGQQDAFRYLLKPIDYDKLVASIQEAYEKKVELQNERFKEEVEEIYRSGMGAKGIRKAIDKLRKIYGIE